MLLLSAWLYPIIVTERLRSIYLWWLKQWSIEDRLNKYIFSIIFIHNYQKNFEKAFDKIIDNTIFVEELESNDNQFNILDFIT